MEKVKQNRYEAQPSSCRVLCKGLWIGGAVTLAVIVSKKKWRESLIQGTKEVKNTSAEMLTYLRENREEIVSQVKMAAKDVSQVVRDITKDVKTITETASHLKESSEEIIRATKQATEELKHLNKKDV
ncbi:hypothetical protein [Halalkalibacterium ligniniphilum]|uniref:hypothetical protein n=1 Tax=Halalkalibacterium ligniniphilum TaxID=1134413 RepID=UPI000345573B|nr:hypothetical protein [Halalkalibacterium ligniniphilum]